MSAIFSYVLMGLLAGTAGGMGLGGGTILVPLLTLWGGLGQLEAQGLNLISFLPAAAAAIVVHWRKGRIQWRTAGRLICFGGAFALAGWYLAFSLPEGVLKRVFGGVVIALGLWQFFLGEKGGKK